MSLADFINANLDPILASWVAFARQQEPAATGMDERALLDHGRLILEEITADMCRPQSEVERQAKSEGLSETASESISVPSRIHARQRERQGFDIEQMVAEYRALRATVIRLWSASREDHPFEDLEDVVRFNEAVDQATAESLTAFLHEVNKTRDLFLGVLGHDLRGPLSAIANCMALEVRSGKEQSPRTDIVLRSVAQMKALLDDLLEYTRNRLGAGLPVKPTPLHLETFVRDTLNEIEAVGGGQKLPIEVQGDTHGEWDAPRLHQAISNLVFNALKYGDRNSIGVHVDGRDQDMVFLSVENTGKIIPPALLVRIFDPLVRSEADDSTDSAAAGANLGLGLYVVREIAAAHHGTVEVISSENITRFQLSLPRYSLNIPADRPRSGS